MTTRTPRSLSSLTMRTYPSNMDQINKIATPEDKIKPLDTKGIKQVQGIIRSLQYVAIEVNNKLLVDLSTIGTQKATVTANKNTAITQLLDYVSTYPEDGILFREIGMVLAEHADAGFLN